MFKKVKNESGSVTVEATLALSTFMFAIVTILTVVNICIAQARISYALNTTAKEISQYSYLYSLTGLNQSQSALYQNGINETGQINQVMEDINTVYNEIENLGQTGKQSSNDIDSIMAAWDGAVGSVDNIKDAGNSLYNTIKDIASDPKDLLFGIAKLASSKGLDFAKSRLIAGPLAKAMIKKHLVNTKDGDVEAYLKFLRIVPDANGSYFDGLDFSNSYLFPNGSSEISIGVTYKVKIIALLPLDLTFTFNQTAITHGWLAGDVSFNSSAKYEENDTLWTKATINERSSYIRHMVIADMQKEGYQKTTKLTDVQLYNPDKNEFVMISSSNPLYSAEGEPPKTLADLNREEIVERVEYLCGKMKSTTDGRAQVVTKTEKDGVVTKHENNCTNATNKLVFVVPADEGLADEITKIIANANTNGVKVEVIGSFGNGASATEVKEDEGKTEQ